MTSTTKTESKSPARTSWPTTKPRLNRRSLLFIILHGVGKNAGYGVIVASEQIIVTLLRSLLLDPTNFIPPHSALVPP